MITKPPFGGWGWVALVMIILLMFISRGLRLGTQALCWLQRWRFKAGVFVWCGVLVVNVRQGLEGVEQS